MLRVLIASIPRCGSTFLLRAVGGFLPGAGFPKVSYCAFVRNLDNFSAVPFLKTHSLAPRSLPENVRAIFLFADPVEAVVSTRDRMFNRNHFENCGYLKDEPPDIFNRDDLGYEKIFDTWTSEHPYPVLALRFETLWEHEEAIGAFLGRKIILPVKRPRQTKVTEHLQARVSEVYASLVEKVRSFPDAKLIRSSRGGDFWDRNDIKAQPVLIYDRKVPLHRLVAINAQHIAQSCRLRRLYLAGQRLGQAGDRAAHKVWRFCRRL